MANPATLQDIEDRWRPLVGHEETNARAFLDDAWAILLSRRPNLEADITAQSVAVENVVRVLCAMVIRVLRNPDGLLEEAIDDYKYRRDSAQSAGSLYVAEDELADITPGRSRHRSVRLVAFGEY